MRYGIFQDLTKEDIKNIAKMRAKREGLKLSLAQKAVALDAGFRDWNEAMRRLPERAPGASAQASTSVSAPRPGSKPASRPRDLAALTTLFRGEDSPAVGLSAVIGPDRGVLWSVVEALADSLAAGGEGDGSGTGREVRRFRSSGGAVDPEELFELAPGSLVLIEDPFSVKIPETQGGAQTWSLVTHLLDELATQRGLTIIVPVVAPVGYWPSWQDVFHFRKVMVVGEDQGMTKGLVVKNRSGVKGVIFGLSLDPSGALVGARNLRVSKKTWRETAGRIAGEETYLR